jgi:hypothetical protein
LYFSRSHSVFVDGYLIPVELLVNNSSIGLAKMSDVRGLLVYCADYRCSHSIAISGDGWPDDVRLSDIEARFVCRACD